MELTNLSIGIDVGGTNTKFGLVTADGKILEQGRIKTTDYADISAFVEALHQQVSLLIQNHADAGTVKGIGIGAPNGNYFTGCIEHAPNLHWKGIVPIVQLVTDKFQLPCVLNNDAKAAALGEHKYGSAKGLKDFIMITLGTGVGSGIFVNGSLVYGDKGNAGELGHTVVRYNGRTHWSTGLKGTLESYCSATGIVLTAQEMLDQATGDSLLKKYPKEEITAKLIYDCALQGDQIANNIFAFTGQVLGEALANFVMFSSPEAIILFGGVRSAGDLLMNPTKEYMEKNLLTTFKGQVQLLFSSLNLDDAAILGAAALVYTLT